jgi:hypothetical protein
MTDAHPDRDRGSCLGVVILAPLVACGLAWVGVERGARAAAPPPRVELDALDRYPGEWVEVAGALDPRTTLQVVPGGGGRDGRWTALRPGPGDDSPLGVFVRTSDLGGFGSPASSPEFEAALGRHLVTGPDGATVVRGRVGAPPWDPRDSRLVTPAELLLAPPGSQPRIVVRERVVVLDPGAEPSAKAGLPWFFGAGVCGLAALLGLLATLAERGAAPRRHGDPLPGS